VIGFVLSQHNHQPMEDQAKMLKAVIHPPDQD
jgi:hypothetical protein